MIKVGFSAILLNKQQFGSHNFPIPRSCWSIEFPKQFGARESSKLMWSQNHFILGAQQQLSTERTRTREAKHENYNFQALLTQQYFLEVKVINDFNKSPTTVPKNGDKIYLSSLS